MDLSFHPLSASPRLAAAGPAQARLVCALIEAAVQQELSLSVWQAVHGRVASCADGQVVILFRLNGLRYVAEPRPGSAGEAGGWIVTCLRHTGTALGVRRLQDALLFLVGAIEMVDLFPDTDLACAA